MLINKLSEKEALEKISLETEERQAISLYRYVKIEDPLSFRNMLYKAFLELNILGRIYVATEGINAQFSIPKSKINELRSFLDSNQLLAQVPLKLGLINKQNAFLKLTIKVRKRILADGLTDLDFDSSKSGKHLKAKDWNEALDNPESVVVDMRNCYESEIGRFEKAITPKVATFKEELEILDEILKDKQDKPILLYCTGGIRCEKTSAYLLEKGFKDVAQLEGGIIDYARQIKEEGLESKFKGVNFVFDNRLSEPITNDILSVCHQCGEACNKQTNCKNNYCHLLFIQCENCETQYNGCCSSDCQDFIKLSKEERKASYAKYRHHHKTQYISKLAYSPFKD